MGTVLSSLSHMASSFHSRLVPSKGVGSDHSRRTLEPAQKRRKTVDDRPKNRPTGALIGPLNYRVLAVAEWNFPSGVVDKAAYIQDEVKAGYDVDFVKTVNGIRFDKRSSASRASQRNRKAKKKARPNSLKENPAWNSKVRDVEFDTRYLEYDNSADGYLDQWVRRVRSSPLSNDFLENRSGTFLKAIPDPPVSTSLRSRVGPIFQARVPLHTQAETSNRTDDEAPR